MGNGAIGKGVVKATAVAVAMAIAGNAVAAVSLSESGAMRKAAQVGKPVKHSGAHPAATGSVQLVDASGLKWFINTNITFSTSSSASGAVSEASYVAAVQADTLNGGVVSSTLNDAYDGYNTVCTSTTLTSTCQTGNAAFTIYNKTGSAPTASCVEAGANRQYTFAAQPTAIPGVTLQRIVYIPAGDSFGRWLNVLTNTTGATQTLKLIVSNNLGSDSNTKVTGSSSGALSPLTTPQRWVTSFQNWSGTTSSDPRLGHVFSGIGAAQGISTLNFVDGDDNPTWSYSVTLTPGQTRIIGQYAVAQPTRAAAAAKAALISNSYLTGSIGNCMTDTQKAQMANFAQPPVIRDVPVFSMPVLAGLGGMLALFGFGFAYRRRTPK